MEKYDCSVELARPTRHRNSSDELPRMVMNPVYGFRLIQRSSGAWGG